MNRTEFTPEEWDALPESEKRTAARKILEESFGEPANEERQRVIEEILDKLYGSSAGGG